MFFFSTVIQFHSLEEGKTDKKNFVFEKWWWRVVATAVLTIQLTNENWFLMPLSVFRVGAVYWFYIIRTRDTHIVSHSIHLSCLCVSAHTHTHSFVTSPWTETIWFEYFLCSMEQRYNVSKWVWVCAFSEYT